MPTTVRELFQHVGVPLEGVVPWRTPVPLTLPGIYVVATSPDPDERTGLATAPMDLNAIEQLRTARPELTIDGETPSAEEVAERLHAMWPAGEVVVYIGLAGTDTRQRVNQYYRTRIGARAPHAGGWPVKMLDSRCLWVHYGRSSSPVAHESLMVEHFASNIEEAAKRALHDYAAPLPYANLEYPNGRRKNHGFRRVKESRSSEGPVRSRSIDTAAPSDAPLAYAASFGRRVPRHDYGTCPDCFTARTPSGNCACAN